MNRCRCNKLTILYDVEGDAYTDHLVQEEVDEAGHVTYRCPFTQHHWLGEFAATDKGQHFELRRITAGEREARPVRST
jgi:hypothetical protein